MKTPLKRGCEVKLLDEPGQPTAEIEATGAAGFKPKGRMRSLWWGDRNKTWSSEELDRMDQRRERFKPAASDLPVSRRCGGLADNLLISET